MKINIKNKTESAQILVIVILVLSILTIFIISISRTTQRDINEQVQNKQYESYYNLTEKKLLEKVQIVRNLSSISSLLTDCTQIVVGQNNYSCSYNEKPDPDLGDTSTVNIKIEDKTSIEAYTLQKDQNFIINLKPTASTPYTGVINMKWTGPKVAWIITLDYKDTTTREMKTIKDVFDPNNIYANSITQHIFTFNSLVENSQTLPQSNAISFAISSAGQTDVRKLRIKPIIGGTETSTDLSLYGDATMPPLSRKFTGSAFSSLQTNLSSNSPTVVLELQLPLNAPAIELFDYVLRSETDVVKP